MAAGGARRPHHVVVFGVSGCGKTTVARGISAATGLVFAEADEFHSPANVARMRAGEPLTDADRMPWLRALADWMGRQDTTGVGTVLACSALRRHYRDILRDGTPGVVFVHLQASPRLIRGRLEERTGHFMPPSLLDSQLATLEPLQPDEDGIVLDASDPPAHLIAAAIAQLHL